jgi:hypothetical protein
MIENIIIIYVTSLIYSFINFNYLNLKLVILNYICMFTWLILYLSYKILASQIYVSFLIFSNHVFAILSVLEFLQYSEPPYPGHFHLETPISMSTWLFEKYERR